MVTCAKISPEHGGFPQFQLGKEEQETGGKEILEKFLRDRMECISVFSNVKH